MSSTRPPPRATPTPPVPNLQDGTEGGLGALAASGVGEGLRTALPAAAASAAFASAQSSHGTAAILGSGSSVLVGGDMTALTAADMSMCGGGEAASAAFAPCQVRIRSRHPPTNRHIGPGSSRRATPRTTPPPGGPSPSTLHTPPTHMRARPPLGCFAGRSHGDAGRPRRVPLAPSAERPVDGCRLALRRA